jgi:hypothetical protein
VRTVRQAGQTVRLHTAPHKAFKNTEGTSIFTDIQCYFTYSLEVTSKFIDLQSLVNCLEHFFLYFFCLQIKFPELFAMFQILF